MTQQQTQYREILLESAWGKSMIITDKNYTTDSLTGYILEDVLFGHYARMFQGCTLNVMVLTSLIPIVKFCIPV